MKNGLILWLALLLCVDDKDNVLDKSFKFFICVIKFDAVRYDVFKLVFFSLDPTEKKI